MVINCLSPIYSFVIVLLVLFLPLGVTGCQGRSAKKADIPETQEASSKKFATPEPSAKPAPLKEIEITGREIAKLTDGRYYAPGFSKDGKALGYVHEILGEEGSVQKRELVVLDLKTLQPKVLWNQGEIEKNIPSMAVNDVGEATGITWTGPNRMELDIGAGHGGAIIVIDTLAKKKLDAISVNDENIMEIDLLAEFKKEKGKIKEEDKFAYSALHKKDPELYPLSQEGLTQYYYHRILIPDEGVLFFQAGKFFRSGSEKEWALQFFNVKTKQEEPLAFLNSMNKETRDYFTALYEAFRIDEKFLFLFGGLSFLYDGKELFMVKGIGTEKYPTIHAPTRCIAFIDEKGHLIIKELKL